MVNLGVKGIGMSVWVIIWVWGFEMWIIFILLWSGVVVWVMMVLVDRVRFFIN